METIKTIKLAFKEGTSDKVYHVFLVKADGGYLVNFEFGKRDTKPQTGTKTTSPVDEASAQKIFDKLIKEKEAKGYFEE